ncbi:MAG: hypothetical protein JWL79_3845 [Frankiales bacterium]|nr:hypothetical protein [Frankiales bacterium]
MTTDVKILLDALVNAGALSNWERLDQATQSRWEKFVVVAIPVHQPTRAAHAAFRIERGKRPLNWPARIVYAFKESGVDSFPPASPGSGLAGSP